MDWAPPKFQTGHCVSYKTEANSITKALKTELTKESQFFPEPEPQWVDYLIKISTFSTGFKDSVSHNTKVCRIQFKITRHMKQENLIRLYNAINRYQLWDDTDVGIIWQRKLSQNAPKSKDKLSWNTCKDRKSQKRHKMLKNNWKIVELKNTVTETKELTEWAQQQNRVRELQGTKQRLCNLKVQRKNLKNRTLGVKKQWNL